MACRIAPVAKRGKKDQQEVPLSDIEFVASKVSVLPQVIAALNVIYNLLFGCNVLPEKSGWELDEETRVEQVAIWTDFARSFVESLLRFGYAIWAIAPHDRLTGVPVLIDFESIQLSFVLDEFGRHAYEVQQDGKKLKDVFVTSKYPTNRNGSLTSPLARLIPRVVRWEAIHQEACLAIEKAVNPTIAIEPVLDRVSPNVMAQRTAGTPLTGSADVDNGSFDISLDSARLMNSTLRYQRLCSNDEQQHLDMMLAKLEAPVSVHEDAESERKFLVLRQGYKFASHGQDKPFIPNLAEEDRSLENDVASVLGVPRVYWAESEARFSVDMTLARDKAVVRHWSNYLIPILETIYLKIYGATESRMKAEHKAPMTRITLPSTIMRHELQDLKDNQIITEEQFKRHLAGLYGWLPCEATGELAEEACGTCGVAGGKEEKKKAKPKAKGEKRKRQDDAHASPAAKRSKTTGKSDGVGGEKDKKAGAKMKKKKKKSKTPATAKNEREDKIEESAPMSL